jgi:hypothetical protein
MSTEPCGNPADVENALALVRTGAATTEEAAAKCGLTPEALQSRIAAAPPATPSTAKRKSWSPLEVTFWLPY